MLPSLGSDAMLRRASDTRLTEARRRLQATKAAIKAEMHSYPRPITGCDAQYNRLADDRRLVSALLARLEALERAPAPPAELESFLEDYSAALAATRSAISP
jgi:hypothetical protein